MSLEGLRALAPSRQDPVLQRLGPRAGIYCVGGAVRDVLLGEPADDRDYLVTGATPEEMTAAGFRPVGRDFPVFLHPTTQSEYALARTERKSGQGYKGFVFFTGPEVRLEDDLLRRDLTINAMAVDSEGQLHDPLGGMNDLQHHRLSHVSPAFREDPLRLLRLARFAARWPHFDVADETLALCQDIVSAGELAALVPERIWTELEKGLVARQPSRMLEILDGLEAWPSLVGETWPEAPVSSRMPSLDTARSLGLPSAVMASVLLQSRPAGRLVAVLPRPVQEWGGLLRQGLASPSWRAELQTLRDPVRLACLAAKLLDWAERADLFRRPDRLGPLLQLVFASPEAPPQEARDQLQGLFESLLALPVGEVARAASQSQRSIPEAVHAHRLDWISGRLGCA